MSGIDLNFFHHIPPSVYIVPHPDNYDISASTVRLRISRGVGQVLWDSDEHGGVAIEQITLTGRLAFPGGESLPPGSEVYAVLIEPAVEYASLLTQKSFIEYQYAVTVDEGIAGGFAVQGAWIVAPETGDPGVHSRENLAVSCRTTHIAAIVPCSQGQKGDAGDQGQPYRLISESGAVSVNDHVVGLQVGGGSISISLPDPVGYYSANGASPLYVYRDHDDTGALWITGDGADKIGNTLIPGESVIFQSNGTIFMING